MYINEQTYTYLYNIYIYNIIYYTTYVYICIYIWHRVMFEVFLVVFDICPVKSCYYMQTKTYIIHIAQKIKFGMNSE